MQCIDIAFRGNWEWWSNISVDCINYVYKIYLQIHNITQQQGYVHYNVLYVL